MVTYLLNPAFPLVRYRLGDVASYSATPCPCGRPFPVLARIAGRTNDVIRTPGGKVSVYSFGALVTNHPGVRQFQVHQHADYSVVIKVVPPDGEVRLDDLQPLARSVQNQLGGEVRVGVEFVDAIKHERGKQRTVVSDVA